MILNRRSIRFDGRRFDICSTRNSPVKPSSRRTSSRLRVGAVGVKKFGITSTVRVRANVSIVCSRLGRRSLCDRIFQSCRTNRYRGFRSRARSDRELGKRISEQTRASRTRVPAQPQHYRFFTGSEFQVICAALHRAKRPGIPCRSSERRVLIPSLVVDQLSYDPVLTAFTMLGSDSGKEIRCR